MGLVDSSVIGGSLGEGDTGQRQPIVLSRKCKHFTGTTGAACATNWMVTNRGRTWIHFACAKAQIRMDP